jgi:ABC-type multidrug transport system fused ATPase/permease subunit
VIFSQIIENQCIRIANSNYIGFRIAMVSPLLLLMSSLKYISPGHSIAPIGSGKTSLLNALAGRTLHCAGAEMTGSVLVNGAPRDDAAFRRLSAYVQQDDVLYPHQTVRETLDMAARLRLRGAPSAAARGVFVDSLIAQLGLTKAADTPIGDDRVRGVSGGERKRTNLGVELIGDPAVSGSLHTLPRSLYPSLHSPSLPPCLPASLPPH